MRGEQREGTLGELMAGLVNVYPSESLPSPAESGCLNTCHGRGLMVVEIKGDGEREKWGETGG